MIVDILFAFCLIVAFYALWPWLFKGEPYTQHHCLACGNANFFRDLRQFHDKEYQCTDPTCGLWHRVIDDGEGGYLVPLEDKPRERDSWR